MPGDTVAIMIRRLRLNRDWAMSGSGLLGRCADNRFCVREQTELGGYAMASEWGHSDRNAGKRTRQSERILAQTPSQARLRGSRAADAPLSTLDSGDVGGDMDCSGVGEGTTVYSRVHQPGALLDLGDAHASQGDGESNGDALETSMDIEFTTDGLREKYIGTPRAENNDYLMAIGLSGSLDDALRKATSELASWLRSDYKLGPSDTAIVLGTSIEYTISEIADRNVGIVAKIRKSSLRSAIRTK
jgi:amidase